MRSAKCGVECHRKTKDDCLSPVGLSEWLSERGGSWEDVDEKVEEEEEKIPSVPPGYRWMKDGEMKRRSDV